MANAKKETKNQNWFQRFLNGIVKFGKGIGKAFKNTFYELKKVTWPTKKELITYSAVTIAFMIAMGIVIYLIDLGSGALVNLLISIG